MVKLTVRDVFNAAREARRYTNYAVSRMEGDTRVDQLNDKILRAKNILLSLENEFMDMDVSELIPVDPYLENEIESLQAEISDVEEEINRVERDIEDYADDDDMQHEISNLEAELEEYTNTLDDLRDALGDLENQR